ncbi:MAG: hypothetical protein LUD27_04575 [Clostridia bacterium]|nr:hypothetical protein [Clostridia bacterium]
MLSKVRMIFILLLTLVLATSLAAISVTGARYVSYPSPSNESALTGDSDYSLSYQLRIYNVDQLIAAIANGYSNIIIDESVANPLFVSGEEMEVTSNLILDLNGHEIQRNDRDPMLNVTAGVQLTIIDSSTEQNGSLYNPVGSVLNIDGGVLTTLAGNYESGPRKNEYLSNYSVNNCVNSGVTGSEGTYKGGVIYDGETIGNVTYGTSTITCPVILPQVVEGATVVGGVTTKSATVNGSIYIDTAYTTNGCNVAADTYLYFVMEGAESRYVSTEGAQYSYSYYVKASDDLTEAGAGHYTYVGTSLTSEDDILVTVYAYENDKYIASDASSTLNISILGREVSNFAAIKMQRGSLNVQGGSYYSYFGEDSSYCVSATGGSLSVYNGRFEALEEGVCVRSAADTTGGSTGSVAIYAGEFYSYKGDMAQVENGTVTVTGGAFTKDASAYTATTEGENNSAIDLKGGTMTVSGATFNLNGSYVNGIKCQNDEDYGVVTVSDTTITYNGGSSSANTAGSYNVGIANYGGTINVTDCLFDTKDSNSTGIKSEADSNGGTGAVTANGCYFVFSGSASKGIKADAGEVNIGDAEDVSNTICMFYIDHVADCYGIYADTSSKVELNVNAAQFIMGQGYYDSETTAPNAYSSSNQGTTVFNSAGIYLDATADSSINLKRAVFIMAGSYSAGVYAAEGAVTQTDTGSSGYTSALLIGVTSAYYAGDGLNSQTTTNNHYETKFNNNYYVALYGSNTGAAYAAAAAATYYTSGSALNTISNQFAGLSTTNAKGSYGIFSEGGDITAANVYVTLCSTYGAGIYSSGGNITISDFQCDVRSTEGTPDTAYPGATATADVSSAAIASNGGAIEITSSVINTDAYGFKVDGGSLTFNGGTASNGTEHTLYSLRATATYVDGGSVTIAEYATYTLNSNIATQAGWTDPSGDLLTDYKNLTAGATSNTDTIKPDGIYVTGGSFTSNGTLNITFSGVNNDTTVTDYANYKITSYALRVQSAADVYSSTSVSTTEVDIDVEIVAGTIISSVGGGVLVSKDESATSGSYVETKYNLDVILGDKNGGGDDDDITVTVNGLGSYGTSGTYSDSSISGDDYSYYTYYNGISLGTTGNWTYKIYTQSGHAVKVDNGDLTIYNGTYRVASSSNGCGVYVTGASSNATINGGIFQGYTAWSSDTIGPACSYSLKVLEGNVTVYDGTFDTSRGNCVFIMGSSSHDCQANIYDGSYISSGGRGVCSIGYADVTIGGDGYTPTIQGGNYALGSEAFANSQSYQYDGTLVVNSGSITSSGNAIWFGNSNIKLTINGGTVTSTGSSKFAITAYGPSGTTYNQYVSGAEITITGGTITSENGTAIVIGNSKLTVNNDSGTNPVIKGATYGISLGYSTSYAPAINYAISISNATITGGTSDGCAGIYVASVVNSGFTVSGCTISDNDTTSYIGIQFYGAPASAVSISDSAITASNNGIHFGNGTSSNGTVSISNTSVTSSANGVHFGGATNDTLSISGSTIVGDTNGVYFASSLNGSVTIESSTTRSSGALYGIRFASNVFGSDNSYTFTISNSDVYGGSGIRFDSDTGSYGAFIITGSSNVYAKSGYNYNGLELNSNLSMALTISGTAKVTGRNNYAIKINGTCSGDITVSDRAVVSGTYAIWISSNFTSQIAVDSTSINLVSSNSYQVYVGGTCSGSMTSGITCNETYTTL